MYECRWPDDRRASRLPCLRCLRLPSPMVTGCVVSQRSPSMIPPCCRGNCQDQSSVCRVKQWYRRCYTQPVALPASPIPGIRTPDAQRDTCHRLAPVPYITVTGQPFNGRHRQCHDQSFRTGGECQWFPLPIFSVTASANWKPPQSQHEAVVELSLCPWLECRNRLNPEQRQPGFRRAHIARR